MSINISIHSNIMAYSIDFRKKVLEAYKNKEGCMRDIADRFNVSLIFVFTLWRRYKETGDIIPKPHGGGASRKIKEEGEAFIKNTLQERNDMTENDLCEAYLKKFNVVVSQSTMNRTLNRLNYTLKKKTFTATEKESDEIKTLTGFYLLDTLMYNPNRFVFIDETGSNLGFARLYGRSIIGERAVGTRPHNGGTNISTVGALSINGIEAALQIDGPIDEMLYEYFLEEMLIPKFRGKKMVFVMDNAAIHKSDDIENIIILSGHRLIYTPPYSPEFNPIEMCWSKIKTYLRKIGARSKEIFDQALAQAFETILSDDAHGWFRHCGYVIR